MKSKWIAVALLGLVLISWRIEAKEYGINVVNWIGNPMTEIQLIHNKAFKPEQIYLVTHQDEVTQITLTDDKYHVGYMSVGKPIKDVLKVYPEEWIGTVIEDKGKRQIVILQGKETHFGVATQYISYTGESNGKIEQIQLGYTLPEVNWPLPTSNNEAKVRLEGTWRDSQGREIIFKQGAFRDKQVLGRYKQQYYHVISPNELILTSVTPNQEVDKQKIRYAIKGNQLFLYGIDSQGIPIKETSQSFIKTNN